MCGGGGGILQGSLSPWVDPGGYMIEKVSGKDSVGMQLHDPLGLRAEAPKPPKPPEPQAAASTFPTQQASSPRRSATNRSGSTLLTGSRGLVDQSDNQPKTLLGG